MSDELKKIQFSAIVIHCSVLYAENIAEETF